MTGLRLSITGLTVRDIRAPTSRTMAGSDAVHTDPDYSAAYVVLETDSALRGHGMTFTIGRGNEVVCAAVRALAPQVVGMTLDDVRGDMAGFWRRLTNESQLRWIGPEKGARAPGDGGDRERGVGPVGEGRRQARVEARRRHDAGADRLVHRLPVHHRRHHARGGGRPARSAWPDAGRARGGDAEGRLSGVHHVGGWMGYPDEQVRALCRESLAAGWTRFKIKVGRDREENVRRAALVREEIGETCLMMADANQAWDVGEAIEHVRALAPFRLTWIEEPTSPDDVLGHAAIRKAVRDTGIGVATGEHAHNRVMHKQMLQASAIDFLQMDNCRLGGLNEVLAVLLMAAKFGVPVCPHAGGIGLCEYGQHVALIDYIVREREPRPADAGVRRPPARALRRAGRGGARPLPGARGAGLQHRDARRVAGGDGVAGRQRVA